MWLQSTYPNWTQSAAVTHSNAQISRWQATTTDYENHWRLLQLDCYQPDALCDTQPVH